MPWTWSGLSLNQLLLREAGCRQGREATQLRPGRDAAAAEEGARVVIPSGAARLCEGPGEGLARTQFRDGPLPDDPTGRSVGTCAGVGESVGALGGLLL